MVINFHIHKKLTQKLIGYEKLLDVIHYCTFSLGMINTCSDLFVNCIWVAEIFQAKFV